MTAILGFNIESLELFKFYISEIFTCRTAFTLEAVCPDVLDDLLKSFGELFKILLVEEDLVFVIGEMTVVVYPAFAFCDRQVEIVALGSLDVKEVCTLSCSYRP